MCAYPSPVTGLPHGCDRQLFGNGNIDFKQVAELGAHCERQSAMRKTANSKQTFGVSMELAHCGNPTRGQSTIRRTQRADLFS